MPTGISIVLLGAQYRLSRVYSGGQQYQSYNRIICYNERFKNLSPKFIEGFGAFEFIVESWRSTWSFRKQTLTPIMLQEFNRFRVIGAEDNDPVIRSPLSLNIQPTGLKVGEEQDVFSVTMQDVDASHGIEITAYNSQELGTNTNVRQYDRDVRIGERNEFEAREIINSTPAPQGMTEMLIEGWQA